MDERTVITIGREFGSGGHEIGMKLAERLGIKCYDKELLELAAKESGLCEDLFASQDEKPTNSFLYSLVMDTYSTGYSSAAFADMPINHKIFLAQFNSIKELAKEGSCVIVGRAADYILKDYDNVVRIFIHAPQDYRIQRVMDVYGDTPKEARVNIERSDKARASYYEHISGTHWGDARNYELTVDSSDGVEKTAQFIVRYITGHTQTDSAV